MPMVNGDLKLEPSLWENLVAHPAGISVFVTWSCGTGVVILAWGLHFHG